MSSTWFSLPFSIPSFSAPLSIQRRFISFILKRSLGHLVKPGQLNVDQIDAQIGNGYVEVKDLELDCVSVNTYLTDLPVHLQDGSIGSVIVRIPWPNPFSSTIGLTLTGLHLKFGVKSSPPNDSNDKDFSSELAQSVASVADKFIHEELSTNEEALLRHSVLGHLEASEDISQGLPGSLGEANLGPSRVQETVDDPEGVSIFAGLFERLLARFDLVAADIRIALVHEANAALVLGVTSTRYFTEGAKGENTSLSDNGNAFGEKRVVRIEGIKLSIQNLSPQSPRPLSPLSTAAPETSAVPRTIDQESNDSDLDDETQMMMSQSILSLPPRYESETNRLSSPPLSTISSNSSADSMYQSAFSESGPVQQESSQPKEIRADAAISNDAVEEPILIVAEPVEIQLTTPPPYVPTDSILPGGSGEQAGEGRGNLKLNVSIGIIAAAVRAENVHLLLNMAEALNADARLKTTNSAKRKRRESVPTSTVNPILNQLGIRVRIKDIIALFYADEEYTMRGHVAPFFAKPLLAPYMPSGYTRLHVDLIELSSKHWASPALISPNDARPAAPLHSPQAEPIVSCAVSDISILAFHPISTSDMRTELMKNKTKPIVIFDFNLTESYRTKESASLQHENHARCHSHPYTDADRSQSLPDIDVVEWLSESSHEHGTGLRHWRTRAAHLPASYHRHSSSGPVTGSIPNIGLSTSPKQTRGPIAKPVPVRDPAILATISENTSGLQRTYLKVMTAPIHIFFDLSSLSSVMTFLDAVYSKHDSILSNQDLEGQDSDADTAIVELQTREQERNRLEKIVLDDLNLGMDYTGLSDAVHKKYLSDNAAQLSSQVEVQPISKTAIEVKFSLIRMEVHAPPPRGKQPRSGTLIFDFHSTRYFSGSDDTSSFKSTRFKKPSDSKEDTEEWSQADNRDSHLFEIRRLVIAYNNIGKTRAPCLISLGPIRDPDVYTDYPADLPPLLPHVLVRLASSDPMGSRSQPSSLFVNIPSVHAVIDKERLDGLQLWADDISQWAETFGKESMSGATTRVTSRNTSVVGSRYFLQQTQSRGTGSDLLGSAPLSSVKSEMITKASLSEVFIRLAIPTETAERTVDIRRIDISVSDLEVIVEINPEGKEETVVSADLTAIEVTGYPSFGRHRFVAPSSSSRGNRQGALKVRLRSVSIPGIAAKESRIRITAHGIFLDVLSDPILVEDLTLFVKSPPGAFESVVPSERTQISANLYECALRVSPPTRRGAFVFSIGDVGVSTNISGNPKETALNGSVAALSILMLDDCQSSPDTIGRYSDTDIEHWLTSGYALIANIQGLDLQLRHGITPIAPDTLVTLNNMNLSLHLCADSISGIASCAADFSTLFDQSSSSASKKAHEPRKKIRTSTMRSSGLLGSLDEQAFLRHPDIGPLPDLINDDLPSNPEYLDASFGAAAGLRPFDDEEDEFYAEEDQPPRDSSGIILSKHGGETVRMLCASLDIVEYFYDSMKADTVDLASEYGDTAFKVQARDCAMTLFLYDGYDWEQTRRAIQDEIKQVKRRLAKIRQLLASGQSYNPNPEEVNTVLFNSVYLGLDQDVEGLEGNALLAAIDEELIDNVEDASESSWQSFKPDSHAQVQPRGKPTQTKKLNRSKDPSIEFSIQGLSVDLNRYRPDASLATRLLFTIKNLEILDHIRTSTWSRFLTGMQSDNRGNIRETDSNMVRVELQMLLPYDEEAEQEARLKAKILPLRLHVDQDALDFMKKFFSFKNTDAKESPPAENEIFFQHVEIFPIDIKLDFKPRRVDYRALREGRTIELMNFFHFDGAEMTLRHITLKGITGWPRMFDTLNDLWTPDVKANQLADVISGVSPIRSAVNVGSGVADLILLPIAQYKKDGRIIRGLQKGTTAFVKSTAVEAIRLGARLATGTQVVLEQAESVLGGQFDGPITAEALQTSPIVAGRQSLEEETGELISRYAEQPATIAEGVQSAYKTLSQNIKTAGQTILAVPMEVYERSGKEGPARAVIRAVPIAVLKPMIGTSEAISKTLMGIHNTLDPQAQIEAEAKYKHR